VREQLVWRFSSDKCYVTGVLSVPAGHSKPRAAGVALLLGLEGDFGSQRLRASEEGDGGTASCWDSGQGLLQIGSVANGPQVQLSDDITLPYASPGSSGTWGYPAHIRTKYRHCSLTLGDTTGIGDTEAKGAFPLGALGQ
jgi:hypothetical protein